MGYVITELARPMPSIRPFLARSILSAGLLAAATSASAQDPSSDRTVVGVAAIYAPARQGGDDYRLMPFPAIDLKYGRFFASGRKGVGVTVLDGPAVNIGAAVTYVPGYRRRDAPTGIGRLSGGAGARIAADIRAGMVLASLGATKALSGDVDGALIDVGLALPIRVSERLSLAPGVSATWADAKYNQAYFGVNPAQSAASGLPIFRPGGGIKDVSASLSASWRLNERASLGATASLSKLVGDAEDSPMVVDSTQPAIILSATYRF